MHVSVIIPTYNRKQTLKRAIQSVYIQSLPPFEIIVVDDGSKDGTKEWVKKKYPNIKYIYQKNSGVSSARNKGIKTAQGKYISFLDSDDTWHKDKLKICLRSLDNGYTFVCHKMKKTMKIACSGGQNK